MFEIKKAERSQLSLMLALEGPSGSGKTYSALKLAYGITGDWQDIVVADTENNSATYYADMGPWNHLAFPSTVPNGYHPNNWIKLIDAVEKSGAKVLILDSISHEWQGVGGCLEIVDKVGKGFSGWKTVTPLHRKFIDRMRESPLHIIATMRTKSEYVVQENAKGKAEPKKVGLKADQREGTDYEFGVIFDISIEHYATTSKDRTGLFADRGPFKISDDVGKELIAWAKSGKTHEPVPQPKPDLVQEPAPEEMTVPIYTGTSEQKTLLVEVFDKCKVAMADRKAINKKLIEDKVSFTREALEREVNEHLKFEIPFG